MAFSGDLIFADPGGEYYFSLNTGGSTVVPGIWAAADFAPTVNNAPAGRATTYAIQVQAGTRSCTRALGGNYTQLIGGGAVYIPGTGFTNNVPLLTTLDGATIQTDLRTDALGHLFFTRNGTQIGAASSNALVSGSGWHYIEVFIVYATTAVGSAEVRVDGVTWLTVTSQQTAASGNAYANLWRLNSAAFQIYWKDIYVLGQTGAGAFTTYLGDITVGVQYPNGAGANSQWTNNGNSYAGTISVNTAGVYTFGAGILPNGTNLLVGKNFTVTGFVNGANNQTNVICTASTATTITLGGVTISESHAATIAFASAAGCVDDGINHTTNETWPDDDTSYISDNTAGHISDYAHQALSLTGAILAVVHVTRARKDDAGSRAIRQVCLSTGSPEDNGSDLSLGNTYQYYLDVIQKDPHTSAAWAVAGYNAATFGVKEIS